MTENELRDALMRGHESLYASSPTFHANLEYLVALLPLWVGAMATQAESDRGEEYAAYTQMLRENARPIPVALMMDLNDEEVEEFRKEWEQAKVEPVNQLIGNPTLTWRERAEQSGAAERARKRVEELMKEDPPSPEEFDETMRLYREGWDGNPATRKDYE